MLFISDKHRAIWAFFKLMYPFQQDTEHNLSCCELISAVSNTSSSISLSAQHLVNHGHHLAQ